MAHELQAYADLAGRILGPMHQGLAEARRRQRKFGEVTSRTRPILDAALALHLAAQVGDGPAAARAMRDLRHLVD